MGVQNTNVCHLSLSFAGGAGTLRLAKSLQVGYENDQNSNAGVFVFL